MILPDVLFPAAERRFRQKGNRCSSIGHPCPFTTWFNRSDLWEGRKPIDEGLLRVFGAGRALEKTVMPLLREAGVIRHEESMEWPDMQLSGSMDGFHPGVKAVVDLKSCSEAAFDSITGARDLMEGTAYQRCYVPQVSLYASHPRVMADVGILYFVAKSSHRVKQISWDIGSAMAQAEIARCHQSCEAINTTLDCTTNDAASAAMDLANPGPWCDGCDWSHLCPAYTPEGCGLRLAPQDVTEKIEVLQQLKEASSATEKEIAKLEKSLKGHWNASGPGEYVAGPWRAKVIQIAAADVPASHRKAYLRTTYRRQGAAETEE